MSSHHSTWCISVGESAIRNCSEFTIGDLTYAEKAGMHFKYGRVNDDVRAALRIHQAQFPDRRMPEHTEFFSGYIVNFVKQVCSTSPDMMQVDEELYAIQAWKKAS
ncbi:hypothetical protein TNCV_3993941 [Trichonephila clavipes]|uniref:Uncharacterized protein n=1 Tax=Trichonephila clavipes TaxID=2585209 RepID=A0A8X6VT73_TRICX|nr:hypothetical protein TNCV_3993941 [Trichonephila clavipes]